MANKQQTAVEWLFSQLPDHLRLSRNGFDMKQQAIQMEREQIINARITAPITSGDVELDKQEAEQYYNQNYSFPETTHAMRELTEQEADILEQTFNNYCKSKNNHSLPDGKPE